jgi:hypothetical protein
LLIVSSEDPSGIMPDGLFYNLRHEGRWHGQVGAYAEVLDELPGGGAVYVPGRGRWAEDGCVEFAVAVVVARSGNVTVCTEREREERKIFATNYPPDNS